MSIGIYAGICRTEASSSARLNIFRVKKTSLVVAQNGGFAQEIGSYTWLWAEFNMEGNFARDPYWVEGTWKDALTTLLLPLDRQAGFLLAGRAETPDSLLLQDGARPNDQNGTALLPGISEAALSSDIDYAVEKNGVYSVEPSAAPATAEQKQEETSANSAPSAPETQTEAAATVTSPPEAVTVTESTEAQPAAETETAATSSPPAEKNGEEQTTEPASPRIDTPEPFAIRWGMPQKLTWKDTDEIAYSLIDAHPDQDPLKLSFPKLHKLIVELEDFGDDPEKSSESILESIQMAWYEEVK